MSRMKEGGKRRKKRIKKEDGCCSGIEKYLQLGRVVKRRYGCIRKGIIGCREGCIL